MNVSKCSYTVFAKGSKKEEKLSLKICQNVIPYQKNPIFLGIQFDERLTFNKQVENIQNKCYDRLKIIKILSHKSWKLNAATLIRIYIALIRSIIDYSFFIFNRLSKKNLKTIQAIQNKALRCIYKQNFEADTNYLCFISNLPKIKERWTNLFGKYMYRNTLNKNHLLLNLVNEYFHSRSKIEEKNSDSTLLSIFF